MYLRNYYSLFAHTGAFRDACRVCTTHGMCARETLL